MKTAKFKTLFVIQQNYGQGWEDVSEYESKAGRAIEMSGKFTTLKDGRKREISLFSHDLAEYRLTGYPTKSISRRVLNSSVVYL